MIVRKRSGLSLVEVLTAMALISLLLFFFGSTITGQHKNLTESKEMTREYYAAAQTLETHAQKIRNAWQAARKIDPEAVPSEPPIDPDTPLSVTQIEDMPLRFTRGGAPDYIVEVKNTYVLQADINAYRPLFYYVTDTDIPPLPAPEVDHLSLELTGGATVGYADDADIKIYAVCTTVGGISSVYENYQWYVSKETHWGRNTDIEDFKETAVYPQFPGDYDVLRDKTGKAVNSNSVSLNFLDCEELIGRHVMVTVIPASASGKLGKTYSSENSIYFYGAPRGTELLLHYDANNLQSDDLEQIRKTDDGLFVKKIYNTKKESAKSDDTHIANTVADEQPWMMDAVFGQAQDNADIRGHILSFTGDRHLTSKPIATSGSLTVVTVARSNAPGSLWLTLQDKLITTKYWQWGDYGVSDNSEFLLLPRERPSLNEWVVDVTVVDGGILTYFPGNQDAQANPITSVIPIINEVTVWLGAFDDSESSADIAEVVIYDGAFSEEDAKTMQTFYQKKYGLID